HPEANQGLDGGTGHARSGPVEARGRDCGTRKRTRGRSRPSCISDGGREAGRSPPQGPRGSRVEGGEGPRRGTRSVGGEPEGFENGTVRLCARGRRSVSSGGRRSNRRGPAARKGRENPRGQLDEVADRNHRSPVARCGSEQIVERGTRGPSTRRKQARPAGETARGARTWAQRSGKGIALGPGCPQGRNRKIRVPVH